MSSSRPVTIEELKQWYKDRGLPPEDVTHFYIGKDYKGAKAFGIFKNETTGEFVVYKNKASGERAIRYQGPDEEYAVNEILTKLKEEIQKRKGSGNSTSGSVNTSRSADSYKGKKSNAAKGCLGVFGGFAGFIAAICIGVSVFSTEPKTGYYVYNDTMYYKSTLNYYYDELWWFEYDSSTDEWLYPVYNRDMPDELQTKKASKKYRIAGMWSEKLNCQDFDNSVYHADMHAEKYPDSSYYRCDDTYYYHIYGSFETDWYEFSTEWKETTFKELPEEMQHLSLLSEYAVSSENALTKITDFEDTVYYRDSQASKYLSRGYYAYEDDMYYHLGNEYDSDWYYYNDKYSRWESVSNSALPEEFRHNSLVGDYAYSDGWSSDSYFDDFEDTYFYSSYMDSLYKSNNSDNNDDDDSFWDWDSDDSWDYGDSDWDSDW